jgi:hypothetical protein
MLTTGFAIFAGLLLLLIKLPRRTALKLLHRDVLLDLAVTAVVLVIHFGTFSGLMAATVAGLLTSVGTSVAKRVFGYIRGTEYVPGLIHLSL